MVCTRKTLPGMRILQKYAVRVGGGGNHRFGLENAILIKDNHVALAGGVRSAVERARLGTGHMVKIELEVDTIEQSDDALALGVDAVLLDNMPLEQLRRAVAMTAGRAITEASGRVTPTTAPDIAATGVDLISIGWLTHSAQTVDIGLDYVPWLRPARCRQRSRNLDRPKGTWEGPGWSTRRRGSEQYQDTVLYLSFACAEKRDHPASLQPSRRKSAFIMASEHSEKAGLSCPGLSSCPDSSACLAEPTQRRSGLLRTGSRRHAAAAPHHAVAEVARQ